MLHQSLLLLLGHLAQINLSKSIDQVELVNLVLQGGLLSHQLLNHSLDDSALILKLLVAGLKFVQVLFGGVLLRIQSLDFLLELLELFLRAFTLSTCDLALHVLDLEVGVVEQLLLAGLLVLQLRDVGLQVARG